MKAMEIFSYGVISIIFDTSIFQIFIIGIEILCYGKNDIMLNFKLSASLQYFINLNYNHKKKSGVHWPTY